jgi:hypothetical protein
MLDFYDAAFKSGNAPQALSETQRDWVVDCLHNTSFSNPGRMNNLLKHHT